MSSRSATDPGVFTLRYVSELIDPESRSKVKTCLSPEAPMVRPDNEALGETALHRRLTVAAAMQIVELAHKLPEARFWFELMVVEVGSN